MNDTYIIEEHFPPIDYKKEITRCKTENEAIMMIALLKNQNPKGCYSYYKSRTY